MCQIKCLCSNSYTDHLAVSGLYDNVSTNNKFDFERKLRENIPI